MWKGARLQDQLLGSSVWLRGPPGEGMNATAKCRKDSKRSSGGGEGFVLGNRGADVGVGVSKELRE